MTSPTNPTDAPAPIVLTVRRANARPIHVLLFDTVTFGRDCDGFLIADPGVSRRHAEIRFVDDASGGLVVLRDLESSNGTTCNGRRVDGEIVVDHGDLIGIGTAEIVVGGTATNQPVPGDSLVRRLAREMRGEDGPRSVVVQLGESVRSSGEFADLVEVAHGEGTFTIVFSDIEGSTSLAADAGDDAWMQMLERHNDIVRSQLSQHGGREVKSQGDGFMMSFGSARRAVDFAIAVQRELDGARRLDPQWPVRVRIGVHTGEAIETADGDLFGRHVVTASRIADEADGGEILVSGLVRALTEGRLELEYEPGYVVALKGLGEVVVHRVSWRGGNGA